MKRTVVIMGLLSLSVTVWADPFWTGTWVQRSQGAPVLSLTVEEVGNSMKFTYRFLGPDAPAGILMSFVSQLDGKEVPVMVNGAPSAQTFALKRIDSHHTFAVIKVQGVQTGTSKAEISPDGKVLKVENDNTVTSASGFVGKTTQYWDKK